MNALRALQRELRNAHKLSKRPRAHVNECREPLAGCVPLPWVVHELRGVRPRPRGHCVRYAKREVR